MRTVDYSELLRGTAALAGMQYAPGAGDVGDADFALLRTFHDRRLQASWEIHRWPELCLVEQRTFRLLLAAGTTYGVATTTTTDNSANEVYDVATGKYFQSLQAANLNQAPTIAGEENSAWWAECHT